MRRFAHRGCMAQYPENTLTALEQVAPHVDGVEVDVRRCRSGELVVHHDETLDRVTDGTGRVADTDWETLAELSVLNSGERVPRLAEVFEVVPPDLVVNVELKEPGTAADAYEIAAGYDHEVVLSSFEPRAIREAVDAGFDAVALLRARGDAPIETALDLDCEFVHASLALCFETDVIARAHDHGLGVNAWTADTAEEVQRLVDLGVDGVIADRYDIF